MTAYVAGSLPPSTENDPARSRAAEFLISRQRWSGGWGYNHLCPADADSTAAALNFLTGCAGVSQRRLRRAARFLAAHIEPVSGGVRTYRRTLGLRVLMRAWKVRFDGWQMAHSCVTAAAAEALWRFPAGHFEMLARLGDFLALAQQPDGSWLGYWWDDEIYATASALSFMAGSGQLSKLRHDASDWLVSTQQSNGSWLAPYTGSPSSFATSLALQALAITTGRCSTIEAGLQWLIRQQLSDGSWSSVPMMRIPHPYDRHPERQNHWRVDQLGTGVLIRDQHRRFTTAAVLHALVSVRARFGDALLPGPRRHCDQSRAS